MPPKATKLEKFLAVVAFIAVLAAIYLDKVRHSDRLPLWLYAGTMAIALFVGIRQRNRRLKSSGVGPQDPANRPSATNRLDKVGTWLIICSGLVILVAQAILPKELATSAIVIAVLGAPMVAGICLSLISVLMRLIPKA